MWEDMPLCEECHYKDEDPNICNARIKGEQKPGRMTYYEGCGRYLRESKWRRMQEANQREGTDE